MSAPYVFRHWSIRPDMVEALERYRDLHHPVGDFLQAVISNDLKEAAARADDDNLENIQAFAAYLYNELPSPSQGSRKAYADWIAAAERAGD